MVHEFLSRESFRPLDSEIDWPFFDSTFNLSQEVNAHISPLTVAASTKLWQRYISACPAERHPALLSINHWLKTTHQGPNWLPEFNADPALTEYQEGDVSTFLRQNFKLENREDIFFLTMCERSYMLPFGLFLKCWHCFLANDDEGSILFHAATGDFAQFVPQGLLSLGYCSICRE